MLCFLGVMLQLVEFSVYVNKLSPHLNRKLVYSDSVRATDAFRFCRGSDEEAGRASVSCVEQLRSWLGPAEPVRIPPHSVPAAAATPGPALETARWAHSKRMQRRAHKRLFRRHR